MSFKSKFVGRLGDSLVSSFAVKLKEDETILQTIKNHGQFTVTNAYCYFDSNLLRRGYYGYWAMIDLYKDYNLYTDFGKNNDKIPLKIYSSVDISITELGYITTTILESIAIETRYKIIKLMGDLCEGLNIDKYIIPQKELEEFFGKQDYTAYVLPKHSTIPLLFHQKNFPLHYLEHH